MGPEESSITPTPVEVADDGDGATRSDGLDDATAGESDTNMDGEEEKIVDESKLTEAERNLRMPDGTVPLYKFMLTGGPCGGKTTALARLYTFLRERGFQVITAPEAFTILASNGMSLDFFSTEGMGTVIQNVVIDTQICLEDGISRVLKGRGKPAILLCDRGPMDGAAYVTEDEWNELLATRNVDITSLRDKRYNAVFHMVTAADGAEGYYTLENNQARSESASQARELDRKTQKAWVGHPHMYVLDNSTDFEGKLQRLVDIVSKLVGLPSNLTRQSAKFLLKNGRPNHLTFPAEVAYHIFEVEKVYLVVHNHSDSNYSFIRKRTTIDKKTMKRCGSVFQLTTVNACSMTGQPIEQKRIISAREYVAAYKTRDLSRNIVRQERISFIYNKQSFTIHIYENPCPGLAILHAQTDASKEGEESFDLPPFLDIDRRLQGEEDERKFGAYSLSIVDPSRS